MLSDVRYRRPMTPSRPTLLLLMAEASSSGHGRGNESYQGENEPIGAAQLTCQRRPLVVGAEAGIASALLPAGKERRHSDDETAQFALAAAEAIRRLI